eukprot:3000935-Rhodomonas_salina.1
MTPGRRRARLLPKQTQARRARLARIYVGTENVFVARRTRLASLAVVIEGARRALGCGVYERKSCGAASQNPNSVRLLLPGPHDRTAGPACLPVVVVEACSVLTQSPIRAVFAKRCSLFVEDEVGPVAADAVLRLRLPCTGGVRIRVAELALAECSRSRNLAVGIARTVGAMFATYEVLVPSCWTRSAR